MATEKEIENDDDLDRPISGWWVPTASQLLPPVPGSSSPEAYEEFLKNTMESEAFKQFDEDVENAPSRSLFDFIKKAVNPPPSAFSYARISTMPDYYNRGVVQWPGLPPLSIRKIAKENLAPLMIIGMRTDDVLRYANLSRRSEPWKPGWSIATEDPNMKPDKHIRSEIRDAERFMLNCNIEKTNYVDRGDSGYSSFRTFLGALTRDSLTYDGMAVFTDRDMAGRIRAFSVMSAQNVRLTAPGAGYNGDKSIFAVGMDEAGNIVQEFSRNDLIWHCRNVRADPDIAGYGYSECEMGVRLIQGMTSAIDYNIDAFNRCMSEDAQVLTKEGWKLFGEVDIQKDLFATLDLKTKNLEYQKATDHIWKDYEGDMYHLKSKSLDVMVTPNHRILTQRRGRKFENSYTFTYAKDLYEELVHFENKTDNHRGVPLTSKWSGQEIPAQSFEYGSPGHQDWIMISGDDYCAFMGMYLSEGSLFKDVKASIKNGISIHQTKKSKAFKTFEALLSRILGKIPTYNKTGTRWSFGWRGMAHHVSLFGTDCYSKSIPSEILDATPRQQRIFWDYYLLGDGYINKHGQERIYTTSRKMADQLQELAQKMGYGANISITDPTPYPTQINGKIFKNRKTIYIVILKKSDLSSIRIEKVQYSGKIGCVSVPNQTILVRNKGKIMWTGNSSVPNGMLVFSGSGWVRRTLDYLARLMTNAKRGTTKSWTVPFLAAPADGKVDLIDFSKIKGAEAYYQDFINMMIGAFCTIYRFPATRIGYRVSGKGPDTTFNLKETGLTAADEADPGKEPLLGHLEHVLDIIVKSRWPHLKFQFHGKSPREDAREYEARILSMTQDEKRLAVGLSTMEERLSKEDREDPVLVRLAKIMGMAPVDPSQAGIYQNLASMAMGGSPGGPEAEFGSKKDPAVSEDHGHQSGVRRDSKKESTGKSRRKKTTKPPKVNPDIQTTRLD